MCIRDSITGWGMDLSSEHERYLVEEHFKRPVIMTDYPKEMCIRDRALSLSGPAALWDGIRFFSSRQLAKLRDGFGMVSGNRQG